MHGCIAFPGGRAHVQNAPAVVSVCNKWMDHRFSAISTRFLDIYPDRKEKRAIPAMQRKHDLNRAIGRSLQMQNN
jgi:hypothetical protein